MSSKGKKVGKHSFDFSEAGETLNIPQVYDDEPVHAGGFKPAFSASSKNKRAKTENPYITQGETLNSYNEHSRNSGRYTARKKKTGRNIARFLPGAFDAVYGERAGIPRKPDPTSLLMTIEELGSEPGRTVYVGDSPVDMQTARNAGVFALGVSWGFNSPESLVAAGADAIARTPSELLEYR